MSRPLPPAANDLGQPEEGVGLDDTRPGSWRPRSERPAGLSTNTFAATRFDPKAEEKARADAHAAAAFDLCDPGLALRAVLGVQGVLLAGTLMTVQGVWWPPLAAAAFAGLTATLLWLVTVCALRTPLRRLRAPPRAMSAMALGALAAWLGAVPLWALSLAEAPNFARGLGLSLAGAGLAGLLWAWLDLRARIWAPVDARVRLAELQSRIRPHFLFNALNTALALVRVDPPRAERVLEDLGQLFRVALADAGVSVSLDEELDLAKAYLAIEQVRFGPRLRLDWDVQPGVGRARVPPLMMQPLVENAVRHGVEPSATGAHIRISARIVRGQVVLQVSNGLPEEPSAAGHGMALHNVRERLRLLHDVAAQLDTWREGGVHHARIVIPL